MANYYHGPADNTAAVATVPAIVGGRNEIASIHYSYDAAATGTLTVESPSGTTLFALDLISFVGASREEFPVNLQGAESEEMIVTLSSPGASNAAKLNVITRAP